MIPWQNLDTGPIPGGGELRLKRRGAEFSIFMGRIELMNSRLSGSEEALATLSAAKLQGRKNPHILIGGLGMGFTLRAALAVFGPGTMITVVELVPAVIVWARGPMAELFADSLEDNRVQIVEADVTQLIQAAGARYDAILLDVDNGPDGLTRASNNRLYDSRGLATAHAALSKGGVLAVWSSGPDAQFTTRLKQAGFRVEEVRVKAHRGKSGARHTIWLHEAGEAFAVRINGQRHRNTAAQCAIEQKNKRMQVWRFVSHNGALCDACKGLRHDLHGQPLAQERIVLRRTGNDCDLCGVALVTGPCRCNIMHHHDVRTVMVGSI
jgi:spermidine synthase